MRHTSTIKARASLLIAVLAFPFSLVYSQSKNLELDMSDPKVWTVDEVHLGSKQIAISYDAKDNAVVMQPTWSKNDVNSTDVAVSNISNGRLHSY